MARRRADKRPGLLARVRWANLGRSAALLAACLILVTRGCGPGPAPTARIPALPAPAAPATVDPPAHDVGTGPDPASREEPAVRRRRHRRKRHRPRGGGSGPRVLR